MNLIYNMNVNLTKNIEIDNLAASEVLAGLAMPLVSLVEANMTEQFV